MLQSEKAFLDIAVESGLTPLGYWEVAWRRLGAIIQWLVVLLVGLYVWPVATGLFVRVVGFLPREVADFFLRDSDRPNYVDTFFDQLDNAITGLKPDLNIWVDIRNGLEIIIIVATVLLLGGAIHYWTDVVLDRYSRRDRETGNKEVATAEYSDYTS
jgi:hypothetical protein